MQYFDAIVIGGGIIGTSFTYYLAQRGLKVLLLERDSISCGTTGATHSNLSLHNRLPGPTFDYGMETWQIFKELDDAFPGLFEFKVLSSLLLMEDQEDLPEVKERLKAQQEAGLEIELLEERALRGLDPTISPKIQYALFCPKSARLYAPALAQLYVSLAKDRGAVVWDKTEVLDIIVESHKVKGVRTERDSIHCDLVINCGGLYSGEISSMVGLNIPIFPNRGHIVITSPMPKYGISMKGEYVSLQRKEKKDSRSSVYLVLTQTEHGQFLIGRSGEEGVTHRREDYSKIKELCSNAMKFVPGLKDTNIIRVFTGVRPVSKDELPIVGEVDSPEGFVLACGFGDRGIGIGPSMVRSMASVLAGDSTHENLKVFSPSRLL